MHNFIIDSDSKNKILDHLKSLKLCNESSILYQTYTLEHKQAFLALELELLGEVTEAGILHDVDKLVTYGLLPKKDASGLHQTYATHHIKNCKTDSDYVSCVIDYECARFTKLDKPLNAYNTIMKYRPETYEILKPTLIRFNLNSEKDYEFSFNVWNHEMKSICNYMVDRCISSIDYILKDIYSNGIEGAVKNFYS